MLRIRVLVILVVLFSLVTTTGGGLRGSAALAATAVTPARSFPSPDNVQGLAYGGGSLWATTPSAYNPTIGGYTGIISELNPTTGAVRNSFPFPTIVAGLTHDGTFLYATRDAGTLQCGGTNPNTIVVIDPATGRIVRSIPSPITGGGGGLAALNGRLFAVGALNLDPCANNGQGMSVGVVIAEVDPANGALLGYSSVNSLGITPRELDANGTNLVYGTSTCTNRSDPCPGLTVYTLAPTLTGAVLQTDVLSLPPSYYGVDVNGLAASATELFAANRGDGKIYVFPYVPPTTAPLYPPPTIVSLTPTSTPRGGPEFELIVKGSGFFLDAGPEGYASVIHWNGDALLTTVVSPGELRATVSAEKIANVGVADITVQSTLPTSDATLRAQIESQAARGGYSLSEGVSVPYPFFITETAAAIVGASSGTSANGTATTATGGSTTTATGSGTITLAEYTGNPVVAPPPTPTARYFDVYVASGSAFNAITVRNCDLGGGDTVYWYNSTVAPAAWAPVSGQSYDPATGCVTLNLTATSAPSVTQLTRTEFAIAKRDATPPTTAATATPGRIPAGQTLVPVAASVTVQDNRGATLGTISGVRCWNSQGLGVAFAATDNPGGSGVASLTYSATGAGPVTPATIRGDRAALAVTAAGLTTLRYAAADIAGYQEAAKSLSILVGTAQDGGAFACAAPTPGFTLPAHGTLLVEGTVTVNGTTRPFKTKVRF